MLRDSRIPGLRDWSVEDRRKIVAERAEINSQTLGVLDPANGLGLQLADHMVENAIGAPTTARSRRCAPQIEQMRTYPDSFDATDDGNFRFRIDQGGRHDLDALYRQFETSLPQIF